MAWKAGALAKATCNLPANEGKQEVAELPANEGEQAMEELTANEGEQTKSCSEEAPSRRRRGPAAADEGWLLLGKAGLG